MDLSAIGQQMDILKARPIDPRSFAFVGNYPNLRRFDCKIHLIVHSANARKWKIVGHSLDPSWTVAGFLFYFSADGVVGIFAGLHPAGWDFPAPGVGDEAV